jgi:glutaconate CoA-transferase subunit A
MQVSPRAKDKFMTVKEAVNRFISDGDQVALGGFTVNRNPMALVREIIRQGKKDLHLVVHSQGQSLELLIGAGCVRRVEIAYGGMGRFAPTGCCFRRAACNGAIETEDYSNYQMTLRFMAGAMGLPFVATTSGLETDIGDMSIGWGIASIAVFVFAVMEGFFCSCSFYNLPAFSTI